MSSLPSTHFGTHFCLGMGKKLAPLLDCNQKTPLIQAFFDADTMRMTASTPLASTKQLQEIKVFFWSCFFLVHVLVHTKAMNVF